MKPIERQPSAAWAAKRRVLLKTGIVAALLPTLPIQWAGAAERGPEPAVPPVPAGQRFDAMLYDARDARACAHARTLRDRVARMQAMHGDPTAAWLDVLDPLWRDGPATVAGMTSPSALFCIEQLAHGHGMRVLERGSADTSQALVAWVIGPSRQQEA